MPSRSPRSEKAKPLAKTPAEAAAKKKGVNCASACLTKDHYTFGECVRSKGLQIQPNIMGGQVNKAGESELQAYRDARSQGIHPAGTTKAKVEEAVRISQETGKAYQAW